VAPHLSFVLMMLLQLKNYSVKFLGLFDSVKVPESLKYKKRFCPIELNHNAKEF
jgi:hypothetical protein